FVAHKFCRILFIVGFYFFSVSWAQAYVVTSINPLAFISAALTDGVTETKVLLPEGASPHNYALKPSALKLLTGAELVIWVGPDMESFLIKTLAKLDNK